MAEQHGAIVEHESPDALMATFERFSGRTISAQMMLMYLLIESRSLERVVAFNHWAIGADSLMRQFAAHDRALPARMLELIRDNESGCARIVEMVRSDMDTDAPAPSVEAGIAFSKRLFDWSVQQCPEASVALYSLGNPAILAAASAEILERLEAWSLLGPTTKVLDVGCGTGRLEQALSPKVRHITGIDVSTKMIEAARIRCRTLPNVSFAQTNGRDLRDHPSAAFDLVMSVDAFPYLVQSGLTLAAAHFEEAARVLKPGGAFLISNFSYRDDEDADRSDVARMAEANGFSVIVPGWRVFKLWDGIAFLMRGLSEFLCVRHG